MKRLAVCSVSLSMNVYTSFTNVLLANPSNRNIGGNSFQIIFLFVFAVLMFLASNFDVFFRWTERAVQRMGVQLVQRHR